MDLRARVKALSLMDIVMGVIFLVLGVIVVAKLVGYVPTDLTTHADTNSTAWDMIADILDAFSMSTLVIIGMVIALVIAAFYFVKGRAG